MQQQMTVAPPPALAPVAPPLSTSAQFLLCQGSCRTNTSPDMKPVSPVSSQPSPKEVAEEISKQFKNCLPHTHGESDLHRAAFEGDAEKIRLLLDQIDSDPYKFETINQRNRLGCTPIRLAATGGHLQCLTYLIDAGASIDTSDVKCQTPLFVAVKNRRLECARKLLQAGASPDGDSGNSSTPLYVAFMNRDVHYVLLLLEHGAHPDKLHHKIRKNSQNTYNPRLTSLDAATEYMFAGDDVYRAVKALLIRGCQTDNFCYSSRIDHGAERLINLFYSFGVQINVDWLLARQHNERDFTKQNLMLLRGERTHVVVKLHHLCCTSFVLQC
ncbi:unnamed protein product [Candidula unifasciata]|uniref:Uncharacterized protein n=1 Tax=Candidula unifasciata TaxID=100452 RepID=A0A8S3ZLC7_9EUPU|nr:unnamed protein product [Candidula unifasciata]